MRRRKRARLLTHRRLILMEALLLVGALEIAAENYLLASGLRDELKVSFAMLLVLGFFGSLLLVVERIARGSMGKTHQTIQALPLPTPRLLIHSAAMFGLFLGYARVLDLWPTWLPF